MIKDYEEKFYRVKKIIQEKEESVSDLRAEVANLEERLKSKETKSIQ